MSRKTDWDDNDEALKALKKANPKMDDDILKYVIDTWRSMEKLDPKKRKEVYAKLEGDFKKHQKDQRRELAKMAEEEAKMVAEIKAEQALKANPKGRQGGKDPPFEDDADGDQAGPTPPDETVNMIQLPD
jgi:hypothetical protein